MISQSNAARISRSCRPHLPICVFPISEKIAGFNGVGLTADIANHFREIGFCCPQSVNLTVNDDRYHCKISAILSITLRVSTVTSRSAACIVVSGPSDNDLATASKRPPILLS